MLKKTQQDVHILKYFSSFITVSEGSVTYITEPSLRYCPLAHCLYRDFRKKKDAGKKAIKQAIKQIIESKIQKYGFFTSNRIFICREVRIPYGASEMLMFALKKHAVDAAVVVCDGAGTVVVDRPKVVQGIGARMNSLVYTSPIQEIIRKLRNLRCRIISEDALIDQIRGVREAAKAGYKKIAVTISGNSAGSLKKVREIEAKYGVLVVALAVCTTGIDKYKADLIRRYADVVWSCASAEIREKVGARAILQLSKQIPVFVLTKKGIDFVSSYAEDPRFIKNLDTKKQYIASNKKNGKRIKMGNFSTFISEACLPVSARRIPCFAGKPERASL